MKAAILEKLNAPLVIDDIEIPHLQTGQVLVKVHRSGICGAQINEVTGVKGPDRYLPHLLGHEGGGVAMVPGPGVTHIRKDDHVVMHWRKGVGIESAPPKYERGDEIVGGGPVTTFNEFAVVSENRLTPIPKDIPFEIAALMGCSVTTGLGLINNEAKLKIGQSIAVLGCGGVGLNVIQGAAMVSANPIIGIDICGHKLKAAKSLGATHVVNAVQADLREEIRKIVGGKGVDVCVECTGLVEIMAQACDLTASAGRLILVGQPRHNQDLTIPTILNHFGGKVLMCSQGGQTNPVEDIPRYLNLYCQGKLRLDALVTHRYPLDKVNTAFRDIRNGKTGRCMLVMS